MATGSGKTVVMAMLIAWHTLNKRANPQDARFSDTFLMRHAYFTGAKEPYDNLMRALRAEIDEAAWSSLYSTVSQAFDKPETGKFAVKVINHYGDEVLKVFEI